MFWVFWVHKCYSESCGLFLSWEVVLFLASDVALYRCVRWSSRERGDPLGDEAMSLVRQHFDEAELDKHVLREAKPRLVSWVLCCVTVYQYGTTCSYPYFSSCLHFSKDQRFYFRYSRGYGMLAYLFNFTANFGSRLSAQPTGRYVTPGGHTTTQQPISAQPSSTVRYRYSR